MFLLALLQLISCRASGMDAEDRDIFDPSDLDAVLAAAREGDFGPLEAAGENGGDGAWFALAAAAADSGDDVTARLARIRSAEEDIHPFGTLSLAMVLHEEPGALRRPLARLRKAADRYGEDEHLRAARIAVLAHRGRTRLLLEEYADFTGTAAEAPVLAAAMDEYPGDPAIGAAAERFILHSPEPGSLAVLPAGPAAELDAGYPDLLQARLAYADEDYLRALKGYAAWMEAAVNTPCDLESTPPVFAEMAAAAAATGAEAEWGIRLSDAARDFAGSRRHAAAFQAGKLKRAMGDYPGAAEDFLFAAGAVGKGLQKDRALWYALRVSYQQLYLPPDEERELWNLVLDGWESPERFDDQLEMYVHRRIRAGEWNRLETVFVDRGGEWPASIRAHTSLALAFAVSEERLAGRMPVGDYLEKALEADPVSWAGFRAAGLLNREISLPEEPFGSTESVQDSVAALYLDWKLESLAYRAVLESPSVYSGATIRRLSDELAEDSPRLSIRVAGLLWQLDGYYPDRQDLRRRHPLPFGNMAADFAAAEGVPPEIYNGLIRTESAWDARAVSRSGAMGLAQFMPPTWEEWVGRKRLPADSDPGDAETNAALGAAYLAWLYERDWTAGWVDSLASYNAGGGRIRTWRRERPGLGDDLFGESIPVEEPRSYIRKVLSAATVYGYLYTGTSPRILHESWGLDMIEVD